MSFYSRVVGLHYVFLLISETYSEPLKQRALQQKLTAKKRLIIVIELSILDVCGDPADRPLHNIKYK